MVTIVKIAGIIFVSMAVWFFIDTKVVRKIAAFFVVGSRIYVAATIRIALGLIFILAAGNCRKTTIITIIGLLMLISGISIFALGIEKARAIIQWMQGRSDLFVRFSTLILFALGCLSIYAA